MSRQVVLVVDDNAENRALAEATLEDEDYAVVLANDGAQGIAAFERDKPDCILLDVRMPGMDGVAVCQRIRAMPGGDEVAIIFVTAQRDVETFDATIDAGGDDFITKPFRPGELLVRVQTAMRLRHGRGERTELNAQIKRQRDQLQRLQLAKEQFTAFLVHDLKNPVNSIELQAQLIARDKTASPRLKRAGDAIQQETRSLLRMITNLLDIAKADEGRLAPTRETLDPRTSLAPLIGELEERAAAANIKLTHDITATTWSVDPDLIERVLANLVENAIRYSPDESEIAVTLAPVAGATELRVRDHGTGVAADAREKIFERFQTSGAQRSNRGLGLTFCKLAVEAHGGSIWVEDASPGATFVMRIPDGA